MKITIVAVATRFVGKAKNMNRYLSQPKTRTSNRELEYCDFVEHKRERNNCHERPLYVVCLSILNANRWTCHNVALFYKNARSHWVLAKSWKPVRRGRPPILINSVQTFRIVSLSNFGYKLLGSAARIFMSKRVCYGYNTKINNPRIPCILPYDGNSMQ